MADSTLEKRITQLENEVNFLKSLLEKNGINYKYDDYVTNNKIDFNNQYDYMSIEFPKISIEHVDLFYSYFHGRKDAYAKRGGKLNYKTKKHIYYTQCENWGYMPKNTDGIPNKHSSIYRRYEIQTIL